MDASEFADTRWRLKVNQKRLAEILDVHPTTVNRWEKGAEPIRRIVDLAMRGLLCEQECRAAWETTQATIQETDERRPRQPAPGESR